MTRNTDATARRPTRGSNVDCTAMICAHVIGSGAWGACESTNCSAVVCTHVIGSGAWGVSESTNCSAVVCTHVVSRGAWGARISGVQPSCNVGLHCLSRLQGCCWELFGASFAAAFSALAQASC